MNETATAATAALDALLSSEYEHAEELLKTLPPAQLRRLALAAQDLAHLARAAALRPYLGMDEIAGLGRE